MKLYDLKQGSPEWHAFRKQHIGASECFDIIKGGSRALHVFKTKDPLYIDEANAAMKWGSQTEDEARKYFELLHGIDWTPVVGEHLDYPWMSASLDGWDGHTVLEIKCPLSEKSFAEVVITNKAPEKYFWQVQHQLCVSEAKAAILAFYFKQEDRIQTHEICLSPDPESFKTLIEKERAFWFDHVKTGVAPALLRAPRSKELKAS